MRKILFITILTIGFLNLSENQINSQTDATEFVTPKLFLITTMGGGKFVGIIISDNPTEVVIKTKDRGDVSIPKYQVKSIEELKEQELDKDGKLIVNPLFGTRYYFSTNAFAMKKGESYINYNFFGPEVHFGVGKNFGLGVMTTWIAAPIVGSAKYTINLGENTNFAIGSLFGGSWSFGGGAGALPFAALTLGNQTANINFSGGYFVISSGSSSALYSVGIKAAMGKKISFVFDSFIIPLQGANLVIALPGLRFQDGPDRAFQFGLGVIAYNGEFVQIPLPILSWFRRIN